MKQGLFECLTGRFNDGTLMDDTNAEYRKSFSIIDHLGRLFNTRKGSLSHFREYGLPDISDIFRKMPDGIQVLRYAITEALERFEPRLHKPNVVYIDDNKYFFRLVFNISGEINHIGRIYLQAIFTDSGGAVVTFLKLTGLAGNRS